MNASISVEHIREAASSIDRVFLHSPQFVDEHMSAELGVTVVLKVETVNPIRTFKGRGTDYLVRRLGAEQMELVCASAGNFGQGMAYACRRAGKALTVFAAEAANPLKLERIRGFGAEVVLRGWDFDEAKDAAKSHALRTGAFYVEDGLLGPIAEGAGTIAMELTESEHTLDAVFAPVGNGSLINGIATWLKHLSPTRVIGVCAESSPSMQISWMAGRAVDAPSNSIADGIAVRVPVPEAVELMRELVDEVMLVSDEAMIESMRRLLRDTGLIVEPSGAAGVAAIIDRHDEFAGKRVATVLTGGNLTEQQIREWLY